MDYSKRDDETVSDWLERLDKAAKKSIKNIEDVKSDMIKNGVVGFCPNCGCDIYKDKEHKC